MKPAIGIGSAYGADANEGTYEATEQRNRRNHRRMFRVDGCNLRG